jgi:hypothetical protein
VTDLSNFGVPSWAKLADIAVEMAAGPNAIVVFSVSPKAYDVLRADNFKRPTEQLGFAPGRRELRLQVMYTDISMVVVCDTSIAITVSGEVAP